MSLSSVCVVLNALRLRRFKVKRLQAESGTEAGVSKAERAVSAEAVKIENREERKERNGNMKYELVIKGMMCQHCQKHASDALNAMEGVKLAEVNLSAGTAEVHAEREISMDEFAKVIADAGYELVR